MDVSLFPPIAVNDAVGRPTLNRLSLSALVGGSSVLDGAAIAGLVHAAGTMRGVQLSGISSVSRTAATGVQIGGISSTAGGGVRGVQLSGIFNYGGRVTGAQVSTVNVAGDVSGFQLGVVNVGGKVGGVQLGVVNVADDVDVPIGLVNVVKNGRQHLEVYATETSGVNVALKLGSRYVHTVLGAGVDPGQHAGETRWTTSVGLGGHAALGPRLSLDVDGVLSSVYYGGVTDGDQPIIVSLRPALAWAFAPRLSLFAAPSANLLVSWDGPHDDLATGPSWDVSTGKNEVRIFLGFALGLRI